MMFCFSGGDPYDESKGRTATYRKTLRVLLFDFGENQKIKDTSYDVSFILVTRTRIELVLPP